MSDKTALHATVYGHVQGVYFRAFVAENANKLSLTGWVKNLESGAVEVLAEGDKKILEELNTFLQKGPPHARVDRIDAEWSEYSGKFKEFRIAYF